MSKQKAEWNKVGTVGGCDVMATGDGGVCIVIEKTWYSARKIKTLFANKATADKFLAEYDTPKAKAVENKPVKLAETPEFKAAVAASVQAAIEAATAKMTRLTPEAVNAAIGEPVAQAA